MGILDVPGARQATTIPKWVTATAYTAGQQVISPNGDVVSAIANHTSGASFTPANWNLSSSFVPQLAAFEGVPAYAYGHSYVANQNQTSTTGWTGRVANRLRTAALNNQGVAGYTMAQIAQRILTTWTPGNRGVVMLMGVMNDLAKYNVDSTGAATLRESLRAALAVLTSGAIYGANHSCLVYNGAGWAAGPTANVYGGVTKRTTTIGDHVDFSFNGDTAYLLTQFVGDTTGGTVTITNTGTGTQVAQSVTTGYTSQLATYSAGSTPGVIRLSGFGTGAHSVRATLTAGTGFTVNAVIIPNPSAPTVVVAKEGPVAAYLTGYDGSNNGGVTAGNTALTGTYEPAMDAAVANFASAIATPTGGPSDWDAASMCGQDGLHPNDKGSYSIATAVVKVLSAISWRDGLNWQGSAFTDTPTIPAYTTGSATAPATPAATALADNQIKISWGQVADNGSTISGYTVRYSPAGANTWTTFGTFGPGTLTTTITTGLTATSSYDVQVSATNVVGQSAWSATSTATAGTAVVIYAADTFNRADSTTTLGTTTTGSYTWTYTGYNGTAVYTPVYGINSSQAYPVTINGEGYALIDDTHADATLTFTAATKVSSGVVFRYVDTANFWLVYQNSSGNWQLLKKVTNAYTVVGTGPAAVAGDVVKITASGSSITVKVNGTTQITATDAFQSTATKKGLWAANGSTAARWDDFQTQL